MAMSVGQIYATLELDDRKFTKSINSANKKLTDMSRLLTQARNALLGFFSVRGMLNIGRGLVEIGSNAEQAIVRMEVATGDLTTATQRYEQAMKHAFSTPFSMEDSIQGMVDISLLGLKDAERALMGMSNIAAMAGTEISTVSQRFFDARCRNE